MDRQKLPPPVSTKITRKLASESTEHNSLLNFYSSISTDETGAPKRWKMSSNVQYDEELISSGKSSPVPTKGSSRDNSSDRKGRPGPKKGWKERESTDNASSRESSLDIKEKVKGSSEVKRESSNDSVKSRRGEESTSRSKSVDKVKFYGASGSKVNGSASQVKRKGRPKSLDLNSKLANGEDESFKSPDPLTPCNIAVKRKKGRPKETPPTLVAESPVDVVSSENTEQTDVSEPKEIKTTNEDSEKINADVEDSSDSNVKKKRGRPKDKTKITNLTSKSKLITAHKLLGQRKGLKGPKVLSKLKGMKAFQKTKQQGTSKTIDEKPAQSEVIKHKGRGRPPGAKNKSTLLKEQMMAKQLEDQEKQQLENEDSDSLSQKQSVDTSASDNDMSITQTDDDKTEQVSDKFDNSNMCPKEDQNSVQMSEDKTIGEQTMEDTTTELPVPESENSNFPESDFVKVKKARGRKPLRLKKGGVKSIGKLKKEEIENKKVRKKRILNSYTGSCESGSSLDHLPKNDLRRYLQMKLIERLSGNRSTSHNLVKPAVDPQLASPSCGLVTKSDTDEVYSEKDSLPAIDPARDNDIQNLSALVEQKRVRTESDASDKQRRSASRSRKSSVDLSKISDNESVSSEISTNSISSAKRIFILGEDKSETDDSIRTRQRVEIVPGKSRKRTLSGEFDLVDEHQLRKEKKMARKSGSVDIPTNNDDDAIFNEVTPVSSPIKVKKKTSPKLVAIKQKLDAQIEKSIPFASQVRKRLLKQSPFLTRMRRKKKRKPENRGLSPNKMQHVVAEISTESSNLQDTVLKTDSVSDQNIDTDTSSIETDTNNSNDLSVQDTVLKMEENDISSSSDKALISVENHDLDEKVKDNNDIEQQADDKVLMEEHSDVKAVEDKTIKDEDTEIKPISIETEVEDILYGLITKVLAMNYSAKDESSPDQNVVMDSTMLETPLFNNEQFESAGARGRGGKRKGRPRKIKRHFGRQKMKIPIVRTTVVRTGAKRGRKPKSAKPLESPDTTSVKPSDSTSVRTFELRQKISRSPLDNIALKQSIEESEYYKSEVQRANKKEAKLLKSKRSQVIAPEETLTPVSVIPYEPAPQLIDTSLNDTTETATEAGTTDSELSDTDVETPDPPKTTEDYLRECKPCSVVLKDFFQQLQRAQQHPDTQDDESATETEDFGEDVNEIYSDKQTAVGNQSNMDEVSENTVNKLSDEVPDSFEKDNVIDKASSKPLNSPSTLNKKELKRQTTFSSSQLEELNSVSPKAEKIKSPHGKKKTSSPKTPKSIPEHQTARKTVPPLKIKLKVGINKTYMVESSTVGEEPGDSPPLHRPVKKKKKSSSKSGSDSDRGNKSHHHHHHKKRNKSPLVGPLGSLTEKKSKPTAIVAASPSVKPPPVPKDPYEATFLEFIQNKEKDMAMTQAPVVGKVRPVYDHPKFKEMQVTMTTASISSQSAVISSLSTLTDKQSPVSLYNSISKNTSLVNSYINDNLKKSMENAVDVTKKKEGPLFIGVVGTKGNSKYFCSLCENEVHDREELVVKHFALVHPGAGIMYRRVADTQPSEQLGTSSVIDMTSQTSVPSVSSTVAGINGAIPLAEDKTAGDQLTGQDQSNSELKTSPANHNRESSLKRDDDTESDAGSLNLKIVEVVSLKDQEDNVIDVEESAPQVESSQKVQEKTNNVVQPELKIPQFQRSTHSTVQPNIQPNVQSHVQPTVQPHLQPHLQQGNVAKSLHHNEQILQTYPSTKPLQRKTPGLITPGKFRNTFKCEKCNVHAPVLGAMVAHLRNSHTDIPRLFQCPYCRDIEAETEALIHQHIRKKHPTDNLNPPVALSEKAKSNLRTLSVRVPDNKANDASFLEKDIYMCLNCKVHMPSLEAIYDHLERVHTEVFVFVCSACKVFKSKTEQDVLVHCQTDPVCRTREKNISLAIDGNQFIRVPCLIKEKNKNKSLTQQTKPPQQQTKVPSQPHASQVQSIKQQISQLNKHNTNTPANSIVQALQKQSITPAQIMQHGLNMQQYFQQQFAPMIAPAPVTQPASGALVQQPGLLSAPLVLSQPPTLGSQPVLVSPTAIVPQVNLATQPTLAPQSFLLQPTPVPAHPTLIPPSSVSRTPASQQPVFPHPSLAASTPTTTVSSSNVSSTSTLTSVTTTSSVSSVATSSNKPSVSPAPLKPTGAKKRKNLLESIQHIKMQKQREQMAKMEKLESDSASERDYLSPKSDTPLDALSSSPSPVPVQSESGSNNQAPPPLIRGPPPLIRFDQLNQVSLSAAVPMQSGVSQQAVKQISSPLQLSKSDLTKQSLPPRQIQSSLFDTSDPEAFKPVQRTPVLNVPSVPRSNRSPAVNLSSPKPTQLKPGGTPLDLSRTPPTNSPASSPGLTIQDKPVSQNKLDIPNPDMYSVFNLKPSTQAQLPKEALQSRLGVHQLPQKVAGPPQTVRPNTANTLAYRPPHPHVSTTQVPQVINMPLGMLNNMGNVVVSMPSFQLVQNMPAQFIRMTGAQLITSPGNQVPVNVSVAMPNATATRPTPATQTSTFQPKMTDTFKCPYCPKVVPLTYAQVKPHIDSHHPGCSVMYKPVELQ